MITYSDLSEALRKERYNEKLQKISKNFLEYAESYFKEKKDSIKNSDEDSIFGDEIKKMQKQLEQAKSVIKELFMLRQKKVLNLALVASQIGIDKNDVENMLENEKELLESTTEKLEKNCKEMSMMLKGEKKKDLKNQLIRFTQDTPAFLDDKNSPVGPFKKGDVANLPKSVVSILEKGGMADTIE